MLATIKNVTIDNNNEELVTFAQNINFEKLFNHIKETMKLECNFYQPEITTTRGDIYIHFMSDDISNQTGAFAGILENCYIGSFSNGVYKNKETGEPGYWVQVNIQYQHKNGGSNGMEVVTAWYDNTKGWIFKNAGM
jgi:hypothetical protein